MQVIEFEPLAFERVWGGRRLEELFGKKLPPGRPIGELWEIVDREEAQSVEIGTGRCLHELWNSHRAEIFGARHATNPSPRFPLLIKLLDASDVLSVQVHPPAPIAKALHGEPKTEMWYFADCTPGACIYAGLRRGVTREDFQRGLQEGRVEELLHKIPVRRGDSIFIPSGRLHAIGAGCVIMEIQQNSDTTYRVFDWNRTGLDGKPRALHIPESLASTDFEDYEPQASHIKEGQLAACEHFRVNKYRIEGSRRVGEAGDFMILGCAEGLLDCGGRNLQPGHFLLCPAPLCPMEIRGRGSVLEVRLPVPSPPQSQ